MTSKIRKRKDITPEYLRNATYRYLERYASSEENLRRVLREKVKRRLRLEDGSGDLTTEHEGWIDEVVQYCRKHALINDELYAASKARSFVRSGNSRSKIIQKLLSKGISRSLVDKVLSELSTEMQDSELFAAVGYVRRRRFGAFAVKPCNEDKREKEMASMARAGFSYELSRQVLDKDREELEDILFGAVTP
ncbi:regulatory protein RecX [Emcibacter sp.]|uniref:regulatory protein RecX n=1 Tax=Emcibacter sp. TaxID=1979954 RepID=UPI002AA8546D|nr:RecX family transcriptional regulator [Emcibacter sp.]